MTNKEAIKWIEYVANKSSMTFDDDSDETRLIREKVYANIEQALLMAIKALETSAWIPVGERLPDTGTMVLLYIPPRDVVLQQGIRIGYRDERNPIPEDEHVEHNFWGMRTYGGEWHVTGWGYYDKPIPTAWMPLPEPYREDGEE